MTNEFNHLEQETQLWVGPQHPGITGNMSVQVWLSGDTIQRGITHVGYLHRGFEKLMERRKFIQSFPIVCRICVPEPDTNEYLLAASIEELAGITIPEKAVWLRTLVMEMSRLTSLLHQLGGGAGATGLGAVPNWTYALRDFILDRFEELTGGRVYHMYMAYGGVRRDVPEGFAERMEGTLQQIEERLPAIDKVTFQSSIWLERTTGVGLTDPEWVRDMGITGPSIRAMGIPRDVRKDFPYLAYSELDFAVITSTGGDIRARIEVRRHEIVESIKIIRQILRKMPKTGPYAAPIPNVFTWKIPTGQTYVRAEASRGEMGYYVVTDGSDKVRRVHVRGPSYIHGFAMAERMFVGLNIADLHPTLVSIPTCPPEMER